MGQGLCYADLVTTLTRLYADDDDGPHAGEAGAGAGRLSMAFEDDEGEWIRMAGQADLDEAMRYSSSRGP
jgi:hypothetical protein